MKLKFHLILALLLATYVSNGQSILFQENFESGGGSFTLNGTGVGTNTGTNEWIVNNSYTGGGVYSSTMSEDSTFGGTISYAPYSYYLHIYDIPSGYVNCNYNPANTSDRFAYTANGACTFGDTGVAVNFFYLCQGSANAYGTVYYSVENGPWTQCGLVKYNSKYKWQYTSITNPAFNNKSNLRIGFRWQNNAGAGNDTSALSIDDFSIIGYQDIGTFTITTTVSPDTICANSNATVLLTFTQSDSTCSGANYDIDLYDSVNNVVAAWTALSYSSITNGPYALTIPNTVTGTHCYRWRVDRTSPPAITGVFTGCFYVENCPNTITTLQPVATMDSGKTVCAGSTIQVPFYSTGTYANTNVYYAELSDSAGNFSQYDSLLNSLHNGSAFPPSGSPGQILVKIPDSTPAGCNYYLRVLSFTPHDTGTVWGPFCVVHCDMNIKTPGGGGGGGGNAGGNSPTIMLACVHSCYKDPNGWNDTLNFSINSYASNVTYGPGNMFEVQILSTSNLSVINTGAFGIDTASGKMILHVPCADSLCNLDGGMLLYPAMWGGYGGNFYLRIIATNAIPADSNVGPLILFNIGYPNDSLSLQPSPPHSDEYCAGQTATFYADPLNTCTWDWYNTNTTYKWLLNNAPSLDGLYPGVSFNEPEGTYSVSIIEDNNGCYSPWDTTVFYVTGPPSTTMSGPIKVCKGDTAVYTVPFNNNSEYKWTISKGTIIDTANNTLTVKFDTTGYFQVKVVAYDSCGTSSKVEVVHVISGPTVTCPNSICRGVAIPLSATGGTSYAWTPASGLSCTTCENPTAYPPATTIYTVSVSNGTCIREASIKVFANAAAACCNQTIMQGQTTTISATPVTTNETYSWVPSTGLSCTTCASPLASPTVTTTYTVTITDTTDGCPTVDSVTIIVKENCGGVWVPDAFSPNGDGQNDILYAKGNCITNLDFSIYDRWGNRVFHTDDITQGWDGTYNHTHKPMNTGTYVYYIQATTSDNKTYLKKGNITLVR